MPGDSDGLDLYDGLRESRISTKRRRFTHERVSESESHDMGL